MKQIALTFDDGPSNVTEEILDILKNKEVKASFFLIGDNITPKHKDIIKREVEEGHEIANHSLTHQDMTKLSEKEIKEEISKTTSLIEEYAGVTPHFFRPPYISVNQTMHDAIDLPFICGIGCLDWEPLHTASQRVEDVLRDAKDGNIVLLHDLESNYNTVKALPEIIDGLRAFDYEFLRISDLFKLNKVNPKVKGKIWSNIYL